MFSDLIKSKKSPSQARIDQLLKELFSADSERDEDEDSDEMDKGGALDYLKRHRGESARAALKSYSTEDDELEKAEGEDSDEDGDELEKKAQRASEEMSELFDEAEDGDEDDSEDKDEAEDGDKDEDEDGDEGEDMKKGDMSKEDKAERRDLMSRAYSIIDDLSDDQLTDFLSASEIKKALIMGVIDRLSTPELKEFCSPEQANGATGAEPMSEG
jgi:hypothetical protein